MADLYSETVLEHYRRPRNRGRLPNADATAQAANPLCGDVIRFEITVNNGTITEARFSGDACAIGTAAASILTGIVFGAPLGDAARITEAQVIAELNAAIPPARMRCAVLPLEALRECITRYPTDSSSRPSVQAVPSPSTPSDVQERLWPESA
jgi:nitrogen fixation protein NifU and related proteins